MNFSKAATYDEICAYLLNHPTPRSLAELLRSPATFDRDVVMVTGRYVASAGKSELRLNSSSFIWLDMPYNDDLNNEIVEVTGTFTAMSTAPGRPPATICAVSHITRSEP